MTKFKIAIQVPHTEYGQIISAEKVYERAQVNERVIDTKHFISQVSGKGAITITTQNMTIVYTYVSPEILINKIGRILSFAFESLLLWGQYTFILEINGQSFSIHNDTDYLAIEASIALSIADYIEA